MVPTQPCRSLSRDALLEANNPSRRVVLDWETRDVIARLHLRRRGCRAGEHRRRQLNAVKLVTSSVHGVDKGIPTILSDRSSVNKFCQQRRESRVSVRRNIICSDGLYSYKSRLQSSSDHITTSTSPPSLYLLNAASLAKLHATELLSADLTSYRCDVAIITESHFKTKHTDGAVSITDYSVFRRDRLGRRGGGVAVYVHSTLPATEWKPKTDNRLFELLWVRIGNNFIGALYHPPRPSYNTHEFMDFIDVCLTELTSQYPTATIILAGDFNHMPDVDIVQRTGLLPRDASAERGYEIACRPSVCP